MDIKEKILNLNGFRELNPMQELALNKGLDRSVVVSSPTASGKTIVMDLWALHSIINEKKKVIVTAPLKALAQEHYSGFKKKYSKQLGIKAVISTGDLDSSSKHLSKFDIIFATNEKCLPFDEFIICKEDDTLRVVKIGELFDEIKENKNSVSIQSEFKTDLIPSKKYYAVSLTDDNDLEFSEIESITRSKNKKNLIQMVFDSGRRLTATSDHKLIGLKNSSFEYLKSEESKGKYIAALADSSPLLKNKFNSINVLGKFMEKFPEKFSVKFSSVDFDELVNCLTSQSRTKRRAKQLAKYYLKNNTMPLKVAKNIENIRIECICGQRTDAEHELPVNIRLTESLGKILGYFISEGTYSKKISNYGSYGLRYPVFNMYVLEELRTALEKENIPFSYFKKNSELRVKSKQLYALLKYVWGIGDRAATKKLPDFVFFAPDEFICGLFKGLFNGDAGPSTISLDYSTKNKELAYQISLLLTRFNVHAYIYPQKVKGYAFTYNRVSLFGGENIERFISLVEVLRPKLMNKARELINAKNRRDSLFSNLPASAILEKNCLKTTTKQGMHLYQQVWRGGRIPKEYLINYALENNNKAVWNVCKGTTGFLKVKNLKDATDEEFVFNIKTRRGNYFTGNGILVKNCDSLLRHESSWLSSIGLLVVDEIHELDSDRGPTLEMVITKLRVINPKMKILGLSATIPNANEVAEWLNAELVESDYRPIPLNEGIYFNSELIFNERKELIEVKDSASKNDMVNEIVSDTLSKKKQALVFANSRKRSEGIARKLAATVKKNLNENEKKKLKNKAEEVRNALEQPTTQCKFLSELIEQGVSFHHAGLVLKQRALIEDAFRDGLLKVISSTPTLAAGINLPSFRVVIPSLYRYARFGNELIPVREYKQMAGRASRPQYDDYGESILIAKNEYELEELTENYVNGSLEEITSKLGIEPVLRTHLLSLIANNFIGNHDSMERFFSKTFYAKQFNDLTELFYKLNDVMQELQSMEFVRVEENGFKATLLGKRVSELYLDPVTAYNIVQALRSEKAQSKSIGNFSYLFLLADCFELYPYPNISKSKESLLWAELQEEKSNLFFDIDRKMYEDTYLIEKYWLSKLLLSWISEVEEQTILKEFNMQPGILRSKLKIVDWLVYSAIELEKAIDSRMHFKKLNDLRHRLKYGIKEELLPFVQLKNIGRVRARMLYKNGIASISSLKKMPLVNLAKILGENLALDVKKQLGEIKDLSEITSEEREELKRVKVQRFVKDKGPQTNLGQF